MDTINTIKATGKVVKISFTEDRKEARITLHIKDGAKDRFPKFKADPSLVKNISEHDVVSIEGYLAGAKKKTSQKAFDTNQFPIATEVSVEEPALKKEFNTAGGSFYLPGNITIFLSGTVDELAEEGDWTRFLVHSTTPDGEDSTLKLSWNGSNKRRKFKENDNVCIYATMATNKKQVGDTVRSFYDLIVLDMDYLCA